MRTMVVGLFLLVPFCLCRAQPQKPLRISGDYSDRTVHDILSDLESRTPLHFFYKESWLPKTSLAVHFESKLVNDALTLVLKNTNLDFIVYMNAVVVAPKSLLEQEFDESYFIVRANQRSSQTTDKWSEVTDFITLGDSVTEDRKKLVTVAGLVTDKLSGDSLPGVNMQFAALKKTTSTDTHGRFSIVLPTGYNLVEVSHVGFESRKMLLKVYDDGFLKVALSPEAHELREVMIMGEADDSNVQTLDVGVARLRPSEIKQMPVFMGEPDVIKSITTLPGVSTAGEGAGGFNVRGGNIDQNLILQDQALIFNSSHALGFFSIFNPDALRDVVLYKGHIPAQYGGRLSSVLDVNLKGESSSALAVNGGIGVVSSHLTIEGPVRWSRSKKGTPAKTIFLIGGRLTYSDWILQLVPIPDIKHSSAGFNDLNVKLTHRYSDKGSLSLSLYQSFDNVQFAGDYGFSWRTRTASLIWNQLITPDLSSSFSVSTSDNGNTYYEPSGIHAFNLNNGIGDIRVAEDLLLSKFHSHSLNFGAEAVRYLIKQDILEPRTGLSTIVPRSVEKDNGQEGAVYINDEYTLSNRLAASGGLRFNIFQQVGPGDTFLYNGPKPYSTKAISDTLSYAQGQIVKSFSALEPRLALKLSPSQETSIKLSYNRLHQYVHLISNTTAATPVDFWQVSGPYIDPETADNYSLGYFRNFRSNTWETSLEVYYRKIQSLIEYKDLPDLLLNDHIETELLSGIGRSYGVELYIKKRKGRINGWLSYTLSRSLARVNGPTPSEKINDGQWYPSQLDIPHNLNIGFRLNISRSSSLSSNFTLISGRPITLPSSNYIVDQVILPDFDERNGSRIPTYHRLDLSYTIKRNVIRNRKYKDSFTFSIYNLYGRKNAYSIYFSHINGSINNAYKLSILGSIFPSLTYNFEF